MAVEHNGNSNVELFITEAKSKYSAEFGIRLVYDKKHQQLDAEAQKRRDNELKDISRREKRALESLSRQETKALALAKKNAKDGENVEVTLDNIRKQFAKKRQQRESQYDKERAKSNKAYAKAEQKAQEEALALAIQADKLRYNTLNSFQREHYNREKKEKAESALQELKDQQYALQVTLNNTKLSKTARAKAEKDLQKLQEDIAKTDKARVQAKAEEAKWAQINTKASLEHLTGSSKLKSIQEKLNEQREIEKNLHDELNKEVSRELLLEQEKKKLEDEGKQGSQEYQNLIKALEESTSAQKELNEDLKANEDTMATLRETFDRSKKEKPDKKDKDANAKNEGQKLLDERAIADAEADEKNSAEWAALLSKDGLKNAGKDMASAAANKAIDAGLDQISDNVTAFYQYQATVESRLQGSDESFKGALKTIRNNVGMSGVIAQKDVINKIKEASDAGIAYNLELRAFLGTVSENIANTFDAFDSNLLRMIRLQQADTTAARLGMEASLTKLFNKYFSDNSYLSDVFDTVSQNILEASAQMNKNNSIEFEHAVQKWLGALYSLGISDSAVSTISEGINYLSTGNVEALNSNEELQNLLAMSAAKSGGAVSYADALVNGLNSKQTNDLLKSMVEYLREIATDQSTNKVTKSAYANIFGMNVSDLTALSNITDQDITNIHKETLNYDQSLKELTNQFGQLVNRIPISQLLDTVFENAMSGASITIGNNAGLYGTWKALDVFEDLTGGFEIPDIHTLFFGLNLNTTIAKLGKLGVGGIGFLGSLLGSLFGGGGLFGTNDLKKWGYEEYNRVGGVKQGPGGVNTGTSESAELSMKGNASGDAVEKSALGDSEESRGESKKGYKKEVDKAEKMADDAGRGADAAEKSAKASDEIRAMLFAIIGGDNSVILNRIFNKEGEILNVLETIKGNVIALNGRDTYSDKDFVSNLIESQFTKYAEIKTIPTNTHELIENIKSSQSEVSGNIYNIIKNNNSAQDTDLLGDSKNVTIQAEHHNEFGDVAHLNLSNKDQNVTEVTGNVTNDNSVTNITNEDHTVDESVNTYDNYQENTSYTEYKSDIDNSIHDSNNTFDYSVHDDNRITNIDERTFNTNDVYNDNSVTTTDNSVTNIDGTSSYYDNRVSNDNSVYNTSNVYNNEGGDIYNTQNETYTDNSVINDDHSIINNTNNNDNSSHQDTINNVVNNYIEGEVPSEIITTSSDNTVVIEKLSELSALMNSTLITNTKEEETSTHSTNVRLTDMSDNVRQKLADTIKEKVLAALKEVFKAQEDEETGEIRLPDSTTGDILLGNSLETLRVQIINDNFDDVIRKLVWSL